MKLITPLTMIPIIVPEKTIFKLTKSKLTITNDMTNKITGVSAEIIIEIILTRVSNKVIP